VRHLPLRAEVEVLRRSLERTFPDEEGRAFAGEADHHGLGSAAALEAHQGEPDAP
jgi:hypothetical protein